MEDFQQRAGTLALPEIRFANLGERIVQAARMAVLEHLRQDALQSHQLPIVVGGANHANGETIRKHPGQLATDFRSSEIGSGEAEAA